MTDENSKEWLFVQMANGRLRALRCANGDLQRGNHLNCIVQNRFGFMFLRLDGRIRRLARNRAPADRAWQEGRAQGAGGGGNGEINLSDFTNAIVL